MAGEVIIVADDLPVRQKLAHAFLTNEGYKVVTAANGNEAAQLFGTVSPDLIFANFETGDAAGFDLIRHLKTLWKSRFLAVAAATPGDEQKALEAGCDASLPRPVIMSALGKRIRELLASRAGAAAPPAARATKPAQTPAAPAASAVTATTAAAAIAQAKADDKSEAARHEAEAELDQLCARFLAEGSERTAELLRELDQRFDLKAASRTVHQWIGTGGLLGYAAISRLARDAENILAEQPLDSSALRETLEQLGAAFASPPIAQAAPLPRSILEALGRKRFVAVEFTPRQQERLTTALDRVGGSVAFLTSDDPPTHEQALKADLILINVTEHTAGSMWLDVNGPVRGRRPVVLAGLRDDLAALPQEVQGLAREFLMDAWQGEEALVRLSLAIAARPPERAKPSVSPGVRTVVVIADDDPAVLALVRTALENFGMEIHAADNGADAIKAIRARRPHAAVLDVNMPGMDGYEVLASVRREELPVRVLLLTARQQESDVLRGFSLGADDYVVKPFSPLELVARLKRLFTR
jgi:DNA-binding response OmpR family regulator